MKMRKTHFPWWLVDAFSSEASTDLVCVSSPLRYLQEVGYTDTILDVKSQRVRALLGLTGDSAEKPSEKKTEPMVNGTEPSSLKDSGMVRYNGNVRHEGRCYIDVILFVPDKSPDHTGFVKKWLLLLPVGLGQHYESVMVQLHAWMNSYI